MYDKLYNSAFLFFPLQTFEFYERVSGARMHAAYVRPGGVNQVKYILHLFRPVVNSSH